MIITSTTSLSFVELSSSICTGNMYSPHLSLYLYLSLRAAPCLSSSGGSCTNTDGSFSCDCTPGTTGHRCQYTTVCDTQPCPVDQLCITTTVANVQGFVCGEQTSDGVVVTLGNANYSGPECYSKLIVRSSYLIATTGSGPSAIVRDLGGYVLKKMYMNAMCLNIVWVF